MEETIPKNMEVAMMKILAKALLLAQEIHEKSWVSKKQSYAIDLYKASILAIKELGLDEKWVPIIDYLNCYLWNDVQMWAEDVLKGGENSGIPIANKKASV